jgi:hypothetical protein
MFYLCGNFFKKRMMTTMTIEYDQQNTATVQILAGLMAAGIFRSREEDDFEIGLQRAISGDELMKRMTGRINKIFSNGKISA